MQTAGWLLPKTLHEGGKGHMASMEKLLASGFPVEITAEEAAQEKAAVKTVQREMDEADEANLLEEEDMHVFDREPLTDRLGLVSCNMCKKPIKSSQYAAHAERCRSLTASDDLATELDDGAGHKKPLRKARKKLLQVQDNHIAAGDTDRLRSLEDDDLCLPESACTSGAGYEDQPPTYGNTRGTKKVMNISEGTVVTALKVGRPRKTPLPAPGEDGSGAGGAGPVSGVYTDGVSAQHKRQKLTPEELDMMCGVVITQSGTCCRRVLTCKLHTEESKRAVAGRRRPFDVLLQELKATNNHSQFGGKPHDTVGVDPLPMATKVYYLRHHQRMRAVLGSLFRDASLRAVPSGSASPDRPSGEPGQMPPLLTLSSDQSSEQLHKRQSSGFTQEKYGKQREKKLSPVQVTQISQVKMEPGLPHYMEHGRVGPGLQHLDSMSGSAGIPCDNGQLGAVKGRPAQGSSALTANVPGVLGAGVQGIPPRQPLGGVSVT
ncbi:unnamed protein product [Sphagnum troendelagicum]|uniref:SCA7 domain-containing protein n=1 Tax=Sphagnum troendelagicum TaxID=128251 RepID=A0ABP0U8N8_9BRYO